MDKFEKIVLLWMCLSDESESQAQPNNYDEYIKIISEIDQKTGKKNIKYECIHCDKKYKHRQDIKYHLNRDLFLIKPFKCLCGESYCDHSALSKHKKKCKGECVKTEGLQETKKLQKCYEDEELQTIKSKQQPDGFKYIELEKKFNEKKIEVEEYIIKYNCLKKTIADLTSERDNLINKTDALENALLNCNHNFISGSNILKNYFIEIGKQMTLCEVKVSSIEKSLEELQNKKKNLKTELNDTKVQSGAIQHNLTLKLEVTNKRLHEVEEQLVNLKEELNEQIKCSIEQAEKINSLTYENNNLVKENSLSEHHALLIEVITSADTFIEQNGIPLASQVENCDEYSSIERVKKVFEALKMFIISFKHQSEQTMNRSESGNLDTANKEANYIVHKTDENVKNDKKKSDILHETRTTNYK